MSLVEAAGVEPASALLPVEALHAQSLEVPRGPPRDPQTMGLVICISGGCNNQTRALVFRWVWPP